MTLGGQLPGGAQCVADTISGPITMDNNHGPITVSGLSETNGDLLLEDNTRGLNVSDSNISSGGDVYVLNNKGAAVTISANTINGVLDCSGNTPPPGDNGALNTVGGTVSGQCVLLAQPPAN